MAVAILGESSSETFASVGASLASGFLAARCKSFRYGNHNHRWQLGTTIALRPANSLAVRAAEVRISLQVSAKNKERHHGRKGSWMRSMVRQIAAGIFVLYGIQISIVSAATISAVSVKYGVTDFSSTGFHVGTLGYWFANLGATSPVTNAPIDQNDANALPSWAVMNFPSSFPVDNLDGKPYAVSMGGLAGANQFTLPDGTTAGSGQLVDIRMSAGGSDTLIKDITFDENAPVGFYFHVVLDNVPLSAGTQISRVRATYRLPQDGNTIVRALFDIPAANFDGIADVYTFRLDGIQDTGYLALQLTTTSATTMAGMAGFAFDTVLVPEPGGIVALTMGGLALVLIRLRRRPRVK